MRKGLKLDGGGLIINPFLTCRTHSSLQKSLPAKKKQLSKSEVDLKAVSEKWEGLRREVGVVRSNLEDSKSSLQANQSR